MTAADEEWRKAAEAEMERLYRETGALETHPINPRTGKPSRRPVISPGLLRELYSGKGLTYVSLAKALSCSQRTVGRLLRWAGIPGNSSRTLRGWEFGGHEKETKGYIFVYIPEHPRASKTGYVGKHTLVMEREIGRYLEPNEVVHHVNHIRWDNRIANLRLMTVREHMQLHGEERAKPKPPKKPRREKISADEVARLYHTGLHDKQIAEVMGCSAARVQFYRTQRGLPPNRRSDKKVDDDVAMEMYLAGASNKQIAARFGCKPNTITHWRRVNGLPPGDNTKRVPKLGTVEEVKHGQSWEFLVLS